MNSNVKNNEGDGEFLRKIIDAMPHMVFVVDPDLQLLEYNQAAGSFLVMRRSDVLRQRGGEVLHCMNAVRTGTCGSSTGCSRCIIRQSVGKAYAGKNVSRQKVRLERVVDGKTEEFFALVTTAPIEHGDGKLVLMVIENIKELVRMGELIPICAKCKKIRDDDQYWTALEKYLKDELDLDFTHGLCPKCAEGYMAELDAMQERDQKIAAGKR